VSIKDELLADQSQRATTAGRDRCTVCIWLSTLPEEQRAELEEIMPDRSFQSRSIIRWAAKDDVEIGETAMHTHRRKHLS
jgi:hypothetical protein